MPQHFVTSALEATGREKVLEFIDSVNNEIFKNNKL
jgi:GTP-binding protein